MPDFSIGVNLIEILTTGMYKDALNIFREYVQNSCDAIDKATQQGILNAGDGLIKITVNKNRRYICIEDNGFGIPAIDFKQTLGNIAQSAKEIGNEKGFRGIGRLCGLAYCDELIFTSTAAGENAAYLMRFDAKKLRSKFYKGLTDSANRIFGEVIETDSSSAKVKDHGFKVELIDVKFDEILNVEEIKKYLSFVVPVKYSDEFSFKDKIYEHAAKLNCKIDEYKIFINEDPVVKGYSNYLSGRGNKDEIFDVAFNEFKNEDGELIAWGWIALSSFKGEIQFSLKNPVYPHNIMRSIRLRKDNIQIGDEHTLQTLFKEPRSIHYFVGEIFAVDKNLIPNSQRDYFIPNVARDNFENMLRIHFQQLRKFYYSVSEVNAAKKTIKRYKTALDAFEKDSRTEKFVTNPAYIQQAKFKMEELKNNAKVAEAKISCRIDDAKENPDTNLSRVIFHLTDNNDNISLPRLNAPEHTVHLLPPRGLRIISPKFSRRLIQATTQRKI